MCADNSGNKEGYMLATAIVSWQQRLYGGNSDNTVRICWQKRLNEHYVKRALAKTLTATSN